MGITKRVLLSLGRLHAWIRSTLARLAIVPSILTHSSLFFTSTALRSSEYWDSVCSVYIQNTFALARPIPPTLDIMKLLARYRSIVNHLACAFLAI